MCNQKSNFQGLKSDKIRARKTEICDELRTSVFYGYVNIVHLKRYLFSVHHKQKVTTFGNFDNCFCKWLFCKKWECCLVLILSGCECCDLRISIFKDCQQAARAIKNYDSKSGYLIKNMVSLINSSFQGITATKTSSLLPFSGMVLILWERGVSW